MRPVFVLPARIKDNPYLTLLYDAVRAQGDFAPRPFSWKGIFVAVCMRQHPIMHIHWETTIYGSKSVIVSGVRGTCRFVGLWVARLWGARVVWTMHNSASHDYPHPRIDTGGRALMWRLADAVIIQNKSVIGKYQKIHPKSRVVFIPHGNYVGVYGPRADAQRAQRRSLYGFSENDTVLLALGAIRPYKQYEHLIDTICTAHKKDGRLKLLIAGKGEHGYIEGLHRRVAGSTAVVIHEGRVPDADMAGLLALADYAVFAYGESSLTSGALLLALSYGVPSIVGRMHAAELITDGLNGFRAPDDASLLRTIVRLPSRKPMDHDDIVASVSDFGWDRVAQDTAALYRSLSVA